LLRKSFFRVCQVLEPEMLLELGAHAAETSSRFVQRTTGRAIAVEANPHTFAERTCRAQGPRVSAINMAVSSEPGELDLHIPVAEASQLLTPGNASLKRRTAEAQYVTVRVPVTTIDTIVANEPPTASVALWIDVEGMALEVLTGGRQLLAGSTCRLIVVEVETVRHWEGQSTASEVDRFLADMGFVPMMRDAEYKNQYNVLYVAEDATDQLEFLAGCFWSELSLMSQSRAQRESGVVDRRF
jgi:FkbM family methyltransferase